MTSSEIRQRFISFFESKGHKAYPSLSLVPDDPTLLLTTAGMVQFKPFFLGLKKPENRRAASVQKCIRTTDIDLVGKTARHLTFFEMLGNFSFGDYYKKEAIAWAWEFLTGNLKMDEENFWITVFRDDDEAVEAWKSIGLSPERIKRMGEEDNFWSAGPTGPCGPSSELLYDQGEKFGCGKPDCEAGCDCDRYLELWNLVFMQYDRDKEGVLHPLKQKGIDTGMGLERLASVLQKVDNNFETDLLAPIVNEIIALAKKKTSLEKRDRESVNIIADHLKAVTFLVSDGVLPSNEGRGYILRRLLRRAIRHGRLLNIEDSFTGSVIKHVAGLMGETYPEIKENLSYILEITNEEEQKFNRTLRQGLSEIETVFEMLKNRNAGVVPGSELFKLYDTYGFPVELTKELAGENGFSIDEEGFDILMEEQRLKSGKKPMQASEIETTLSELSKEIESTEFTGYFNAASESRIVKILRDGKPLEKISSGEEATLILDISPFYATSGGQLGDTGQIVSQTGSFKVSSTDKSKEGLILHIGEVETGTLEEGQNVKAQIDDERRKSVMRNHTATHLLHWALANKFGESVKQAGSLVDEDRLRFDFTLNRALSKPELKDVEKAVNRFIYENHPVKIYTTTFEFAKKSGVTALFGEKYGKYVRVVEISDFSKELCGGTHAAATGDIGMFKILSEGSVGANVRRIEAVTAGRALDLVHEQQDIIDSLQGILNAAPDKIIEKTKELRGELKAAEKKIRSFEKTVMKDSAGHLADKSEDIGGVKVIAGEVKTESVDALRSQYDQVKQKAGDSVIILAAAMDSRVTIIAGVPPQIIERGIDANAIVKKVAPVIGGGGGGKPEMAQAGGKDPQSIKAALDAAKTYIRETVKGD